MSVRVATMPSTGELNVRDSLSTSWLPVCHITYNRDSWVKLNEPPSAYSDEEALLLCEEAPGLWVSWIPGYGEKLLDKSDFYC